MREIEQNHKRLLFVSDTHNRFEDILAVKKHAETNSFDAIILGGDIPGRTARSLQKILSTLLKLNTPLIIYPGSHEHQDNYKKALKKFEKNKQLIDASKYTNMIIRYGDYTLVCIPGSNAVANSDKSYQGGSFYLSEKTPRKEDREQTAIRLAEAKISKKVTFFSLKKIQSILTRTKNNPKKTIVCSHIPFLGTKKTDLDFAKFFIATEPFIINEKDMKELVKNDHLEESEDIIHEGNIFEYNLGKAIKKKKYPLKLKQKNVGSASLKKFLEQEKITKFFCGHIHEAGKRARNKKGERVKRNTPVQSLYVNNSQHVMTEITIEKGNKISYQFINI